MSKARPPLIHQASFRSFIHYISLILFILLFFLTISFCRLLISYTNHVIYSHWSYINCIIKILNFLYKCHGSMRYVMAWWSIALKSKCTKSIPPCWVLIRLSWYSIVKFHLISIDLHIFYIKYIANNIIRNVLIYKCHYKEKAAFF